MLANCAIAPGPAKGVVLAMVSALANISVFRNQVTVATAVGAQFNGSIAIAVDWISAETPAVTLNNLQNGANSPATVIWPTSTGSEIQIFNPGDPMVLAGIINS
jgi:hypothetical protein